MQCATSCSSKLKIVYKIGLGMAKLLQVTRPTAMHNCMSHPKKELGKQGAKPNGLVAKKLRWQEGSHLLLQGAVLGCLPDGKAEGDLIDKVC